ncbi:MAG: hypothetical protein HY664_07660 [Chloroflexi bacterium]|nr:hypothetical protein [Chloroflexota bacterium]
MKAKRVMMVIVVVGAMLVLVGLFKLRSSAALPSYATATGQPCSTCHVNPAGGGTLTAIGQAFAAIPTHSTDPAGAFRQVSAPAPTPTPAPSTAPAVTPTPTTTQQPTQLPTTGGPIVPVALVALSGLGTLATGWAVRRFGGR